MNKILELYILRKFHLNLLFYKHVTVDYSSLSQYFLSYIYNDDITIVCA